MSVKLRKKPLSDGSTSLYLDIYENGQRKYEFLKFHLYKKPRNPFEIQHNKETLSLAESIAAKKQIEMQAGQHNLTPQFRKNINFIEYFEKWVNNYPNKDMRLARWSFNYFVGLTNEKGHKGYIAPKDVTEDFCREYKSYLDKHLNGETPFNYFGKFKKFMRYATKERVFNQNPAEDIKNTRKEGLKKEILNFDEIQKIANTHCGSAEVKRAFLFSLNTGLRFCDIKVLKWRNIDGNKLKLIQHKTKGEVMVDLNKTALKLIADRGKADQFVFNLPSHSACTKGLKTWTKRAGIDKNISWHCARHSFAVNLLWMKNDIKSVSSLLGHSGLKITEKYTHVVDELKKNAVNSLREIQL